MSNSTKPNKATTLVALQALVAGTEKHFPSGTLTLGNTAYTAAEIVQAFQSLMNAINATNAAHVQTNKAVATQKGIEAKVLPLRRVFQRYLQAAFDSASQELADFGLRPLKVRAPLSGEKRVAATVKSKATRSARGTTSKKQKLAVKGDVASVIITPTKVAPVASPTAAPAVSTQVAPAPAGPAPVK